MKKVHAGIIGLGRAGQMHLKNLMTIPEIEIEQVADVFIENVSSHLNDIGITNQTRDYHDILNNPKVGTVFIFTSTNTHEEIVTAAAKAGKNIFCEKPLSMNLVEEASLNVLREVKKAGVKLQIGFNRRMDPQFRNIYENVRMGKIGTPQVVKITSRDPDLLPHDLIQRIGGLLFDFTMHDFDMARYMMNSNITEVYAKGGTLIDPTLKDIDDIDTLALVLQFENGTYGLIDNSRRAVYGYDQRVEVFGSEGMLKAENVSSSTVELYNNKHEELAKPLPIFKQRYHEAYLAEMHAFVRAILEDEPLVAQGRDVIMAQRAAIAAKKSLETGLPQKVDTTYPLD
ncbi:inositol 2-dehydrogenase [Lactiplantibacillus plantarum]|jgi:myo-inositol 2-dehydrogenase/D-chiro-inositol 1-dehydrogenase|uniref:inositol 2-dehydrogenase n=1 Tax=Lactiplantibacillus TaxID=2767842 RepID=UPI0006A65A94|nr:MULTISPECIES: inositol 2-dehydrogenase [Lactiplantibacillus]MDN6022277.1 inositol 2-dehydrogenase [Lactobacillus sp.]MDN6205827.1 inositol 2-dehydrogenase [Staphylococcus simulans]ASD33926.1 inositol 2-dehydrogenase [Lactiplantibacillus plantarum]AXI14048.1 inositol 2-dehydrogenase [Lactiplantibacillus plantarum]KOE72775.1 oxidoreductase [Lactiplantibacillus plantarum]